MRALVPTLALSTLGLLVACGGGEITGDPVTKKATLTPVADDGTARADLTLVAHPDGKVDVSADLQGVSPGDYRLRIYDYGSCNIVREKASNPVLAGGQGTRSVLPSVSVIDGITVASTAPSTWETVGHKIRAVRGEADALERKPVALENADGQAVACGQLNLTATASR